MTRPFPHRMGLDCATSAFRNLLDFHGLPMSEPMAFGLGEGLSFWYCHLDGVEMPVMLGQNPYVEHALCERLGVGVTVHEPRTPAEAELALARVRAGVPTVLKADPYYLEYCWRDVPDEPRDHFGEHVLVLTAVDDQHGWISDIWSEELEQVPLAQIRAARSAIEGYEFLLARDRWYELSLPPRWPDLEVIVPGALRSAVETVHAGQGPFGISGIRHAARALPAWIRQSAERDPDQTAHYARLIALRLEQGMLGAAFRPMFFDFLREAGGLLSAGALIAIADDLEHDVVTAWQSVVTDLREVADRLTLRAASTATDDVGPAARIESTLLFAADREEEMCTRILTA